MRIILKKERIGTIRLFILSAFDIKVDASNKKLIENQLEQYAHDHLLKHGGHVFKSSESDTASVVAIEDVNALAEGEIIDL